MYLFLLTAALLLLELPLYTGAFVASTTSDLGIFQQVTPTTHASLVPVEALEQLSADVYDFSTGYIDDDSFNFLTAQDEAVYSQALKHNNIADPSFVNQGIVLGNVYAQGATSLLENPTAWLARLSASATPFPYSSSLMSQASGLLLGYKSLVSQDILSVTASIPAVTPGVSVKVAPASTAAGATTATRGQTTSATGAAATAQSTSTLKALGVPVATANAQLIYAGVAAAAGIFGIALL